MATRVSTALKLRKMSVELRDTYERLKKQRDELLRLQLQKERLTSFVVHDLKNPVGAIFCARFPLRNTGRCGA